MYRVTPMVPLSPVDSLVGDDITNIKKEQSFTTVPFFVFGDYFLRTTWALSYWQASALTVSSKPSAPSGG